MSNQLVQTLEAIEYFYHDQWVLVKETEWDQHGNPIKGIVIAHSTEREALIQPCIQLHDQEPDIKSYIFFAGDIVPDGTMVLL